MDKLSLYARYAFRSFLRGRSRTVFGVFCIAVGITAVVALGLTGGNFRNSVTGDARRLNRGDVSASPAGFGFTLRQYQQFASLKARGEIIDYTSSLREDNIVRNPHDTTLSAVGELVAVDSQKYPFYDTIRSDQPSGSTLSQLLAAPGSAVVGHDTLASLRLKIGDTIVVNTRRGFNHRYTVTGVVPDSAPNPGFGSGFWNDFVMVDQRSMLPFFHGLNVGANIVYMKTANPASSARVKSELGKRLGGIPQIKTVADVEKDSKNEAAGFDTFFRIMGLVAVVIGGIGIINTMLVAARRRMREIAVLKSLGMKGREVILVFTIESLLLGVAGTIVGTVGGIGASLVVNSVTQTLAGFAIPWSLQAAPIFAGALVGIVATVLFAYLPIVAASRPRPIAALRDDMRSASKHHWIRAFVRSLRTQPLATAAGIRLAPMGIIRLRRHERLRTVLLTLSLAGLIGYLGVLYSGLASGFAALTLGYRIGEGVLIGGLLITQLFVAIVWIISKLPSMGRLPLRMALRSMGTQKRRLGSTLLALCVGILSVGSVAIVAQNLKSFASEAITHQVKVKAIVQSAHDPAVVRRLQTEIAVLPGITRHDFGAVSNTAQLVAFDGRDPNVILERKSRSGTLARDTVTGVAYDLRGLEGRDLTVAHYPLNMMTGRNLGKADVGTNHIVMDNLLADTLGFKIGSHVVFQDGARRVGFVVVGLYDNQGSFAIMSNNQVDATFMRHAGLTFADRSHTSTLYLDMRDNVTATNIARIRHDVPGALVLPLGDFLSQATKAVDKLTLFPEIIAALSLFAGVIIIANTVALAMLERRREIGIMKAVGARRGTILQCLLVENAIVGFLGAGAGVLLAMVVTFVVDNAILKITPSFDPATIGGLLLLGIVLAVGASSLTALPASTETPMTVLRYE